MNYTFKETPNTRGKIIDSITLTGNDYLSFPTFFVEKHKLKGIQDKLYLRMYYDKEKSAVAIQFTTSKTHGTYPVNGPEKYGATCKIKSFLLNNEIESSKYAGKFDYEKVNAQDIGLEGEPVFIIKLASITKNSAEESEM